MEEKKEAEIFEQQIDESEMENVSGGMICTGSHILPTAPSCGKLIAVLKGDNSNK